MLVNLYEDTAGRRAQISFVRNGESYIVQICTPGYGVDTDNYSGSAYVGSDADCKKLQRFHKANDVALRDIPVVK